MCCRSRGGGRGQANISPSVTDLRRFKERKKVTASSIRCRTRLTTMASLESCHCRGARGQKNNSNSILYSILKNDHIALAEERHQPTLQQRAHRLSSSSTSSTSSPASLLELRQQACSCGSSRRRGALRSPQVTCKAASAVLVKTLRFVKNVPCFRELPQDDQLLLVRNGWAPLLVLGLAQDRVDFETTETAEPSMLQRILTGLPDRPSELPVEARAGLTVGVSLAEIQSIKAFLKKCWSLDISTKEYAYLKGAVLFNPDLQGLRCLLYIQSLRQEAHQALNEHVSLNQQEDPARFAKLLLALSMLRSIQPLSVAQLFFKPVIGIVNMDEVLMEMFYGK